MAVSFRQDWINNTRDRRVRDFLADPTNNVRRSIRQGFFLLGKDLRKTASEEILHGKKSGRVYYIRTRSGRRRRHQASAPGESHANITGETRRSIGWHVDGWHSLTFGYGVDDRGPAPDRAEWLEFGTGRMRARPSLQNAMNAAQRNAELYFYRSWRNVMAFERITD